MLIHHPSNVDLLLLRKMNLLDSTMTAEAAGPEGYLKDQPWHFGYNFKLSPQYLGLALLLAGRETASFNTHCELAYGNGVSLVIHATANPGTAFVGTDFNPLHYAFAAKLAGEDTPNLSLFGLPFSQFFQRVHRRKLDVVAMSGTWSWMPEPEQTELLRFIGDDLNDGGVFCHDNMVMPGNAETRTMRQMLLHFATFDPPANPGNADRTIAAVRRAIELMDTNPQVLNQINSGRDVLESLLKEDPAHLAHEYFNYNWTARYFTETAQMMRRASLSFLAPWGLSQSSEVLQFSQRQRKFLASIGSTELREQVKDYIQCRSIRFDIWSREPAGLDTRPILERFEDVSLISIKPLKDFPWVASGSAGEFGLDRGFFGPIVERLGDGDPASISALRKAGGTSVSEQDSLMLIATLIDGGWARPVQSCESEVTAARPRCRSLNDRILALESEGTPIRALASPLLGSGLEVPVEHFAFLRARRAGASSPLEYAQWAAGEPRPGQSEAQSFARSTPEYHLAAARDFEKESLPIYQQLLIDDQS